MKKTEIEILMEEFAKLPQWEQERVFVASAQDNWWRFLCYSKDYWMMWEVDEFDPKKYFIASKFIDNLHTMISVKVPWNKFKMQDTVIEEVPENVLA